MITAARACAFFRNTAGSIAILSATMLPVAMGALALAVDMGSLYLERRQAQSAADLAALAAAANLDQAEAAVAATLEANGIHATSRLTVTRGNYAASASIPHATRFRPGVGPTNAVEVVFSKPGRIYFASVFVGGPIEMEVRAVAATSAMATFSIGSRLLALRDGLINRLLGAMLGSSVSLTLMDYQALVDTDVKLLSFMNALASELNLTGVTYNDVLDASMTAGDVFSAAAAATAQDGNSSVAATLQDLANQAGGASLTVPLSHVLSLGPFGSANLAQSVPGLDAGINAMQLVSATAALANGEHQVALDLGATVPGVLSLKVDLTVGEREQHSPWVAVGQPGSSVYTAQTRLRVVAEIGGTGALSGVRIRLPIALDIAYARATLTDVSCSDGNPDSARAAIAARPGVARAWIGELSAASLANIHAEPSISPARIVDAPLIKVTGQANVAATNTSDTTLEFTSADVANKTVKRVGTTSIVETVVSSLLGHLNLNTQVLGFGLGLPGTISNLVAQALAAVAAPLDQLIYSLLTTLGVHLGEADVRVHGIRCGTAVLAG